MHIKENPQLNQETFRNCRTKSTDNFTKILQFYVCLSIFAKYFLILRTKS